MCVCASHDVGLDVGRASEAAARSREDEACVGLLLSKAAAPGTTTTRGRGGGGDGE